MFSIICIVLLLLLLLATPRLQAHILPDGAYMRKERTSMINGIFIWIVFLSHMRGYGMNLFGTDLLVAKGIGLLGQCCVATFFFYSGFGIMSSLQRKGRRYALQLITRRFPMLLLHMTIAVCLFWVLQTFYGKQYGLTHVLLSFVGWSNLGNSSWFIFISLTSYLLIVASYILCRKAGESAVAIFTAFLLLFVIFFVRHRGSWWYDTCLCIPAGMLFCIWRPVIESTIAKLCIPAWIWGIILVPVSLCLYNFMPWRPYYNNLSAILFAFGVTLVFSCISLRTVPDFLRWSGGPALFYLFIFQRIPMIIGANADWNHEHLFLYQMFAFVCTLLMAVVCTRIFPKLDEFLWNQKTVCSKRPQC